MGLQFIPLDDNDVRLVSYGQVTRATFTDPGDWTAQQGTLFAQSTFGPRHDFRCACGELRSEAEENSICTTCRVTVGLASALRRQRFGHIQLNSPVRHPFICDTLVSAIPVLPIFFRADRGESDLDYLYSRIIEHNNQREHFGKDGAAAWLAELEYRVAALFDNESLPDPITYRGRVIRSLTDYVQEDFDVVFLTAMLVKVGRESQLPPRG
jgi:DNA-directed RNA polymerase beta' subunit